jgi:hypothetical protein
MRLFVDSLGPETGGLVPLSHNHSPSLPAKPVNPGAKRRGALLYTARRIQVWNRLRSTRLSRGRPIPNGAWAGLMGEAWRFTLGAVFLSDHQNFVGLDANFSLLHRDP